MLRIFQQLKQKLSALLGGQAQQGSGAKDRNFFSRGVLTLPQVFIEESGRVHFVKLRLHTNQLPYTFDILEISPELKLATENPRIGESLHVVDFQCNICGELNRDAHFPSVSNRETPSCAACGSNLRLRSIGYLISKLLFGKSCILKDLPIRKDLSGIGMSDWQGYATPLAEKTTYTNTFYHQAPQLDITNIEPSQENSFDFIISSDVFEHIPPPIARSFENTYRLLKPGGLFIFTVPYTKMGNTLEHFPELHDFELIEHAGKPRLVNYTKSGQRQVFDDLIFHGGDGFTLEMRMFSEQSVLQHLRAVGFSRIQIHTESIAEYGIYWTIDDHLPISAIKG